jgi:hypothetical protein
MGRAGALRQEGVIVALVCTIVLVAACGGGDDEDTIGPPRTLPPTTSTVVLNETAARALQVQAAATGSLVGLPENPFATSEDPGEWAACGQPLTVPDQRLLTSRRLFHIPDAPPEESVEVTQITIVHRSAVAASTSMAAVFDLLSACPRAETAGEVTEGWAVLPVPVGVSLDARAATATLTVTETEETYASALGCLTSGPVEQCVSVRTPTVEATNQWFAQAFTATSEHLAEALIR